MKKAIKNLLKELVPYQFRRWLRSCSYRYRECHVSLWECLLRNKVYVDKKTGTVSSVRLFDRILRRARIMAEYNYLYPFDPMRQRVLPADVSTLMSITPDYANIIKSDLNTILRQVKGDGEFAKTMRGTIKSVEAKASAMGKGKYNNKRYQAMARLFPDILYRDCDSLDEAIQKLLFYNALFWQAGHFHNGLGRLDLILYPYYRKDVERGFIDKEKAKRMLMDFCHVIGSQTPFKSVALIGDTGQYILLGGVDKEGITVDNDLTHLFLEAFTEMRIPDPKLILRVNACTPKKTWQEALKCIMNGCGSPLLMNETLVMRNMVEFGYDKEDVWNVGTSACWEPLIIGKSSDQNNPFQSILACEPLDTAIRSGKDYPTFETLLVDVKKGLAQEVQEVIEDKEYDYSPLMSMFMTECMERGKDFSHKGSKYMYQGAQLLGLPNLVNSLINIKEYVYDKCIVSMDDCRDIIKRNYEGHEDLRQLFGGNQNRKFGKKSEEVLALTDNIIEAVSEGIKRITTNGNPVKFGLSSPNYINSAKRFPATLDGRKAGEPFAVHISPISSSIDISEVMDFASSIEYPTNCLNGNVVDFILPSAYQKKQEKFVEILMDAFAKGVFQLQLNVLDKKTLIDAKAHPEKYPTLVVRVWGFSAYFNDLPEEYKDNLIARAETYENA